MPNTRLNLSVHRIINPANEETGHAGDLAEIGVSGRSLFEPGNIGFRDFLIDLARKQKHDIDIDAFANQLPERRKLR